jgi:hypothetical protein
MESQLSHGNPAYRCRHGHSSARPAGMRRAKNLYLREDLILGRILAQLPTITSRETGTAMQLASLQQNRKPAEIAAFLHANNVTIHCRTHGIALEIDSEVLFLDEPHSHARNTADLIPRQRVQQQNQKRGIVKD